MKLLYLKLEEKLDDMYNSLKKVRKFENQMDQFQKENRIKQRFEKLIYNSEIDEFNEFKKMNFNPDEDVNNHMIDHQQNSHKIIDYGQNIPENLPFKIQTNLCIKFKKIYYGYLKYVRRVISMLKDFYLEKFWTSDTYKLVKFYQDQNKEQDEKILEAKNLFQEAQPLLQDAQNHYNTILNKNKEYHKEIQPKFVKMQEGQMMNEIQNIQSHRQNNKMPKLDENTDLTTFIARKCVKRSQSVNSQLKVAKYTPTQSKSQTNQATSSTFYINKLFYDTKSTFENTNSDQHKESLAHLVSHYLQIIQFQESLLRKRLEVHSKNYNVKAKKNDNQAIYSDCYSQLTQLIRNDNQQNTTVQLPNIKTMSNNNNFNAIMEKENTKVGFNQNISSSVQEIKIKFKHLYYTSGDKQEILNPTRSSLSRISENKDEKPDNVKKSHQSNISFDEFKRLPLMKIIGMLQLNQRAQENVNRLFVQDDLSKRKESAGTNATVSTWNTRNTPLSRNRSHGSLI